MSKTLVTHRHPDLDAIMSLWLMVRFDQSRYGDAELVFIPASTTYRNEPVDSNEAVIHTDVGMGKYDHHQEGRFGTCASELVWKELVSQGLILPSDEAVKMMVEHAKSIDLFEDCFWEEAKLPRFEFTLSEIIPALHRLQIFDDEAVARMIFVQFDGVYQKLKDWYKAKQEIEGGVEFESIWGKGIAVEAGSDDVHKVAQRMGYKIVVVGDPGTGYLGIKTVPAADRSLKPLYDKIVALDGTEKWFFHNSGQMVLHGSDKGPRQSPSKLSVEKILDLIGEISSK